MTVMYAPAAPLDERDLLAIAGVPEDKLRLTAAVDVLDRCGGTRASYGSTEAGTWWAALHLRGARLVAEHAVTVADAFDDLVHIALTGATCATCGGLIAHDDGPLIGYGVDAPGGPPCRWRRFAVRWIAGCVAPVPVPGWQPLEPTDPPPAGVGRWSHLALADELGAAGASTDLVALAAAGYFHTYRSPLGRPEVQLMGLLTAAGLHELARRVLAGDFDAPAGECPPGRTPHGIVPRQLSTVVDHVPVIRH